MIAALALLLGHGVWLAVRERRFGPRRAAARTAIVVGLVERPQEALPVSILEGLPLSERRRILGSAEAALAGDQRTALHDLARRAGVLRRAERACRSLNWERRLRGVRVFSMVGGGEQVVPRLFEDRRAEVRAEAALWAAEHPQPAIVARLVALLGDEATLCRFMVKDSLLRLGAHAVEPLSEHLATATGAAASLGLEVATSLRDPRLLGAGLELVGSADPALRRRAVDLLGALGGDRAVGVLAARLGDEVAEVRAAAARALGGGKHWSSAAGLAAALRDPSWDVRREAGLALRALGASGELLLRRTLTDEDRFARDMARLMLDLPLAPV